MAERVKELEKKNYQILLERGAQIELITRQKREVQEI